MYTSMRTQHHKCEEEEERDTLVTKKRGVGIPPPRTGFCIFYFVTYMTDKSSNILVVATVWRSCQWQQPAPPRRKYQLFLLFYYIFFFFLFTYSGAYKRRCSEAQFERNLNRNKKNRLVDLEHAIRAINSSIITSYSLYLHNLD